MAVISWQLWRRLGRFTFSLFALCLVAALLPAMPAGAVAPYRTFSLSAEGVWIQTPQAFVPVAIVWGYKEPSDLFITSDDSVYVADTGNDRIVQLDRNMKTVRTIPLEYRDDADKQSRDPKERLRSPEGVFVAANGDIYVADTGTKRIAVYDKDGNYAREIRSPDSKYLPAGYVFNPTKIVIDQRGYLFVVTKGGYRGMMQLTGEGKFIGFFGANKVALDPIQMLKRKYLTEEQLSKEQALQPGSVTNVTVDAKGFLYTVNERQKSGQLKHLNFAGEDLLGNRNFFPWLGPQEESMLADVSIDDKEIITVIERKYGDIYQYDNNGRMIFSFGGYNVNNNTQRLGTLVRPTSVVTMKNGSVLVADAALGAIQSFKRTAFGAKVQEATAMFNDGRYRDGRELWNEILKLDSLYTQAYLNQGRADMSDRNYRQAAEAFELSSSYTDYSKAYWQLRMNWLFNHFSTIMIVLVGLIAAWIALSKGQEKRRKAAAAALREEDNPDENFRGFGFNRTEGAELAAGTEVAGSGIDAFTGLIYSKTQNRWLISLKRAFSILSHPVSTLNDIVERGQVRFWFAALLIILGFFVRVYGKSVESFMFSENMYYYVNVRSELTHYFVLWLLWVLSSYLAGSVMKGEGSLRKVFIVNAYAMVPFILFNIPIKLLSNVLTLQESIIYTSLGTGVAIWVGVLMLISLQTVHNYNLKETITVAIVSLATFGCLWVFGYMFVALSGMAIDFFTQWGQELRSRV